MTDFALDASTHDVDMQNGLGPYFVTGPDAIAQHLMIRLRTFAGEYFLDRNRGVPYYQRVLVKNPNIQVVESAFRQTALETPGVLALERFDLNLDIRTRKLSISLTAEVTDSDALLDFTLDDFVIG